MRRGEIWWADLGAPWGRRPVLLLARDEAYAVLSAVAVAPITSRLRTARSWILLEPEGDGVPRHCAVNLDAVQVIPPRLIESFQTRLRPERMEQVDLGLHFALGIACCPDS